MHGHGGATIFFVKKKPEMPRCQLILAFPECEVITTPSQMRSNDDEECNQSACPTTKSRPIIAVVVLTFEGSKRIFST